MNPHRAFAVSSGEDRYPLAETVEPIGVPEMTSLLTGLKPPSLFPKPISCSIDDPRERVRKIQQIRGRRS
jgi:hypothetical protein